MCVSKIYNFSCDESRIWSEELQKSGFEAGAILSSCLPCPNSDITYHVVVGNPLNKKGRNYFEVNSGGPGYPNEIVFRDGEILKCISLEEAEELSAIFKKRYQ